MPSYSFFFLFSPFRPSLPCSCFSVLLCRNYSYLAGKPPIFQSSYFLMLTGRLFFFRALLPHDFYSKTVVFAFLLHSQTLYLDPPINILTPSLTKFFFSFLVKGGSITGEFSKSKWPCNGQVKLIHSQWKPYAQEMSWKWDRKL